MEPNYFKEANKTLLRPAVMTAEECGDLPVFTDGEQCISQWKLSFKERLHCLFRGYIWVQVLSGQTQPPIAVSAQNTVFE